MSSSLLGCSNETNPNILDGSNINQQIIETNGRLEVFGYEVRSLNNETFQPSQFKILTTPNEFDCEDTFYASYENKLLHFQIGEMANIHWFTNNSETAPTVGNFEHIDGCYFKNGDAIIYSGNEITSDVKNFKILNAHYSQDTANTYFEYEIIENADLKSFEVDPNIEVRAKDKDNHYINGQIDPNFEIPEIPSQ